MDPGVIERASFSTKSDFLHTDPNICGENVKPRWEEIQNSDPFTRDPLISFLLLLLFFFFAFTLQSGLDSLKGSRTPGLWAPPASGGPEATDAEGRT